MDLQRVSKKVVATVAAVLVLVVMAKPIILMIPNSLTSPTDPYRADAIWGVYNTYLANGQAPYAAGDEVFAWYESGVSEKVNVQYVNGLMGFFPSGTYGRWKSPNMQQAGWGGGCGGGGGGGSVVETGYWSSYEVCTSAATSCTPGSDWIHTGYKVYPEEVYQEGCPGTF